MPSTTNDSVVLFVDMLGFAALLEAAPNAVSQLEPVFQPLTSVASASKALPSSLPSSLVSRFSNFHIAVEHAIREEITNKITAITFSDSAFIHIPSPPLAALPLARRLMRALLTAGVPARMGIGAGSFAALRFSSDNTRSAHIHSTQFLGTAVVHAYEAEKCGIKGLRILLHPSMRRFVNAQSDKRFWIRLPETFENATAEVNYLFVNASAYNTAVKIEARYRKYIDCVQDIKTASPHNKALYYDNTTAALKRMRSSLLSSATPSA